MVDEIDPELKAAYERTAELNKTDLVPEGWYGFAQPIGWSHLVLELHEKLLEKYGEKYKVQQVKQKFGGLRFYFEAPNWYKDDETKLWVDQAMQQSWDICEMCGRSPASRPADGGYIITLCEEHHKVRENTGEVYPYEDEVV